MKKHVWITGAQGFLGRHLARVLAEKGMQALGFGRKPGPLHPDMLAFYPHTAEGFAASLKAHGAPRRVFHLAGGATVGRSLADPHGDFLSNVGTTEVLLEALRGAAVQVPVVFASSAAVYGEGHTGGIQTSTVPTPSSPYGSHKVMAEQLLQAHAQDFGLGVTVLRLFSIYGPGLYKQLLFDACTRLSATPATETLTLGGTGAERRDWLHAYDTAAAMVAVDDPAPGEMQLYNLASGSGTEIRAIGNGLVEAWGDGRPVSFSGKTRAGDPFSLVADPASLPPEFSPHIDLADGLLEFVAWFRGSAAKPEGCK